MSADNHKLINEQIGIWSAVALLVGTAMGMSIFIVPTQMLAQAGPSITIAVIFAILPMVLGVLMLLQLGGALPVAGGIYVYGSRLIGPYWGMIGVAVPVLAVWSYLLFAALGFTQYLNGILVEIAGTEAPAMLIIWGIIGAFLALNYVGIRIVAKVQIAMVLFFLAALLTFTLGMAPSVEASNFTPMFPGELFASGMAPLLLAIVTLYTPFQGFGMIIEMGEEIEDPVKNIPRVLAIGMGIVAAISLAVVIVLAGAVPWQEAIVDGKPVEGGFFAVSTLPDGASLLIALGALVAGATIINALFTSYSRTVMRAARDEIIPDYLAAVHGRFNTPNRAIILLAIPPLVAAPFVDLFDAITPTEFLDWLVVVVIVGILMLFMIGGTALWNLPKVFPKRYEYSIYKLPMPLLRVVAIGNVIVSFVFIIFIVSSAPTALLFFLAWLALVTVAYFYRIRAYENKGESLKDQMALLHKHEQIGGETTDD